MKGYYTSTLIHCNQIKITIYWINSIFLVLIALKKDKHYISSADKLLKIPKIELFKEKFIKVLCLSMDLDNLTKSRINGMNSNTDSSILMNDTINKSIQLLRWNASILNFPTLQFFNCFIFYNFFFLLNRW